MHASLADFLSHVCKYFNTLETNFNFTRTNVHELHIKIKPTIHAHQHTFTRQGGEGYSTHSLRRILSQSPLTHPSQMHHKSPNPNILMQGYILFYFMLLLM